MNSIGQRILDAREDRWLRKKALLEKYKVPVTSVTMNIPGPEKDGDIVLFAHQRVHSGFFFSASLDSTYKCNEFRCG